jgi:hypothetical protein
MKSDLHVRSDCAAGLPHRKVKNGARQFSAWTHARGSAFVLCNVTEGEPVARANAYSRHGGCFRTRRAVYRHGSSLTLGKMTAEKTRQLIETRFGESVEVSHFEVKRWLMDEKTGQSWRDHLMYVARGRLKGAEARHTGGAVLEETKVFLDILERFSSCQKLWSFSASSKTTAYSGWGIDDAIVLCIPSQK